MRVLVAGSGKVALALASALSAAGLAVSRWSRAEGLLSDEEPPPPPDVAVLAVSDDAIGNVAVRLLTDGLVAHATVLLHTAGAVSPAVAFAPVRGLVAGIGLLHPLRAIAGGPDDASFGGTVFGLAGDERGRRMAVLLVEQLGGRPLLLPDEGLARYHAAAVLVANHTLALVDAAATLLAGEGLDRRSAEIALAGLLASAAHNLATLGLPAALTGPLARGDEETIARHLAALPPALAPLYRETALATLSLARRRPAAPQAALDRIEALLSTKS